jgi:predicted GIY-YIG superfamily endonuclease
MNDVTIAPAKLPQQMKLFHLENPLSIRLGNSFFRDLPAEPGVYFFHDDTERLLYIGQSANLKARVGSYRHVTPEKNPKRTLRLVARTTRIVWQTCATAAEAMTLESELLLKYRPPFNRAGVWEGPPWWLKAEANENIMHLELTRNKDAGGLGPFPAGFRHMMGTFLRCIYRTAWPSSAIAQYPHGLMNPSVPLSMRLNLPDPLQALQQVLACIEGRVDKLAYAMETAPAGTSLLALEYWQEEIKSLRRYGVKLAKRRDLKTPVDDGQHNPS